MDNNTRWEEFNSIIDNKDLDSKEKLLLLILFRYVDNRVGYSYPSLETIKNLMGYSHTRYVIKNINELIQKEYLIKETVKQKNRYYILSKVQNVPNVQNIPNVQNVHDSKVQNVHDSKVQNVPTKRKVKENIKENIYSHWNSKNIINHKSLTSDIEKAIEKAVKKYSEEDIIQAINNYADILSSEFYFSYKWSLRDFLNRNNGISTFMNDGSNKANFDIWKKDGERNANTTRNTFRDRGCFNEGAEDIKIELPKREFRHYTNEELAELGID